MKLSLILILSLLFEVKIQDITAQQYSINTFINYLQDNGYWEMFFEVKNFFGVDVTVEFCNTFVPSPHCEEVVNVYLLRTGSYSPMRGGGESKEYLDIDNLENFLNEKHYSDILKSKNKPKIRYLLLLDKLLDKLAKISL